MNGGNARALIEQADQAMRDGDPARAAALLERCLAQGQLAPEDLLRVAAARRAIGDAAGALDAISALLRTQPEHFLALLMGGSLLVTLGRKEDATRAYEAALKRMPPEASLTTLLGAQVAQARTHVERERGWRRSVETRPLRALDGADAGERGRIERFRQDVARRAGSGFHYPGLATIAFFDARAIAGIAELETGFDAILREFRAIARDKAPALFSFMEHAGERGGASVAPPPGKWSVIHLLLNGEPFEDNPARCPETMRLYRALCPPEIAGRSPNLMFSLLDPRTRIPPHSGVTNTRCVMHLPLVVPPDCAIRVGEETRAWEEGRAIVFDDSIEHEAWNDSDALRVVLLGDVWRPELSARERAAVAEVMSAA